MRSNIVHLFVSDKRYKDGLRCERFVLDYAYDMARLKKEIVKARRKRTLEYIGWNAFACYMVVYR